MPLIGSLLDIQYHLEMCTHMGFGGLNARIKPAILMSPTAIATLTHPPPDVAAVEEPSYIMASKKVLTEKQPLLTSVDEHSKF